MRQRVHTFFGLRMVLQQALLGLAVLLLLALWLQVPDASALDVLGSVLLGLAIVAAACGGETWLILRLGGRSWTRQSALTGSVLLLAALLLWWAFASWMGHLDSNTYLYASYLNSKLPHGLRTVLSFRRMTAVLRWLWTTLTWAALAALAVPAVAQLLSTRPVHAIGQVFRSVLWWVAVLLAVDAGVYGTAALTHWVPGHGLGVETLSLLLRLAAALLLDATLVSLLLCLTAALVNEDDPPYRAASAGTPEINQPRAADGL